MAYSPNSCTDNSSISESEIVSLYPEILIVNPNYDDQVTDDTDLNYYEYAENIGMTMDILAVVGRLEYVITLLESDHGEPLVNYLEDDSLGAGYKVTNDQNTVTVSCSTC